MWPEHKWHLLTSVMVHHDRGAKLDTKIKCSCRLVGGGGRRSSEVLWEESSATITMPHQRTIIKLSSPLEICNIIHQHSGSHTNNYDVSTGPAWYNYAWSYHILTSQKEKRKGLTIQSPQNAPTILQISISRFHVAHNNSQWLIQAVVIARWL